MRAALQFDLHLFQALGCEDLRDVRTDGLFPAETRDLLQVPIEQEDDSPGVHGDKALVHGLNEHPKVFVCWSTCGLIKCRGLFDSFRVGI